MPRHSSAEYPGSLQAVQSRHRKIQNNQVRAEFLCFLDPLKTVSGFAADVAAGNRFEYPAQTSADDFIVVDNEDAFRFQMYSAHKA
jgi:hypothetical protein